ncbi:laccase domain protein Cgl2154/cg2365 [Spirochaetia bacterium]|nr:laccase domain protein Cgl2154/cg2365 [Spirochaetia bacterium]
MALSNKSVRNQYFESLGIDPDSVVSCVQSHSQEVLLADPHNNFRKEYPADGLLTMDHSLFLSVTVADCLPVFLYDAGTGGFAIVHSGWKGTGIALHALMLMEETWGTAPEQVSVLLGPCIHACCYQVEESRARFFAEKYGAESIRNEGSAFFLDMQQANIRLLTGAGVAHIGVCENCTFTDESFGSFRRQGPQYTRMAAVIGPFIFS